MNEENLVKITGYGLKYPLNIVNGKLETVSGLELIDSNLKILLTWDKLTRLFGSDYGTILKATLEEPNDLTTRNIILTTIKEAIAKYYPIVELVDSQIQVSPLGNIAKLLLTYKVVELDIENNLEINYNLL
jgi:phage baseplate assembly protein W